MSPGTVDVTAVFSAITVTAPTGTTSKDQGAALDVTWTTNQAVATGQFSIWVVSPANGWYVGKIHDAADTVGPASYADSVDLNVPAGTRLPRLRLLPRQQRRPLGPLRHEPGDGGRAEVFSAITVTAPTGTTSKDQGAALPVTWTTNQAVATGQFSIWVVSPGQRLVRGQDPRRRRHRRPRQLRRLGRPERARPTRATASSSTTAPRSGDPWGIYGMSPGTVDVNAP